MTDLLNNLSVSHIDEVGDYEIPKEKKNTVTVGQITSTQSEVESNTGKCLPICVSQTQANRGHILYDYGDLFVCVSFFPTRPFQCLLLLIFFQRWPRTVGTFGFH